MFTPLCLIQSEDHLFLLSQCFCCRRSSGVVRGGAGIASGAAGRPLPGLRSQFFSVWGVGHTLILFSVSAVSPSHSLFPFCFHPSGSAPSDCLFDSSLADQKRSCLVVEQNCLEFIFLINPIKSADTSIPLSSFHPATCCFCYRI